MPASREYVYSTDPAWCARCRQIPCACVSGSKASATPLQGQTAKLRLEKSGRGGKIVTVVFNLTLSDTTRRELLKTLQKACGTGGTLKDATLELQGDHRDRLETVLSQMGLKVKRAGG